jgi:hypothetical protein
MYSFDLATQAIRERTEASGSAVAKHRATWRRLREARQLEERLSLVRGRLSEGRGYRSDIRDARARTIAGTLRPLAPSGSD